MNSNNYRCQLLYTHNCLYPYEKFKYFSIEINNAPILYLFYYSMHFHNTTRPEKAFAAIADIRRNIG
jgi:hypothetical protein